MAKAIPPTIVAVRLAPFRCFSSNSSSFIVLSIVLYFTVKLKKIYECETVPKQVEVEKQSFIGGIIATLSKKSQDSSQDGVGSKGGNEEVYTKDIK